MDQGRKENDGENENLASMRVVPVSYTLEKKSLQSVQDISPLSNYTMHLIQYLLQTGCGVHGCFIALRYLPTLLYYILSFSVVVCGPRI